MSERYDMKYIPSRLFAKNLYGMSEVRKDSNIDWVHGNLGDEGTGKSNMALLMYMFLAGEFNLDNICFSPEQFMEAVDNAKHGDVIVLDEGAEIFFSKTSLHKMTVDVERLMLRIRFKELFIIINIPDFLLLTRDMRKRRIKTYTKTTLTHTENGLKQGSFKFFGNRKAKQIRKSHTGGTLYPRCDFGGTVPSFAELEPEHWNDYLKKKAGYSKRKKESKFVKKRRKTLQKKMDNSLTVVEMAKIIGVTPATIRNYLIGKPKYFWTKSKVFVGLDGLKRVEKKCFDAGLKRLNDYKNKVSRRGRPIKRRKK